MSPPQPSLPPGTRQRKPRTSCLLVHLEPRSMSSCAVIPGHRYEPASQLLTSCSQSELARQDSKVDDAPTGRALSGAMETRPRCRHLRQRPFRQPGAFSALMGMQGAQSRARFYLSAAPWRDRINSVRNVPLRTNCVPEHPSRPVLRRGPTRRASHQPAR